MSLFTYELMTNHHGVNPFAQLLHLLGDTLHAWRRRYVERRELAALSELELHDIGKSEGIRGHAESGVRLSGRSASRHRPCAGWRGQKRSPRSASRLVRAGRPVPDDGRCGLPARRGACAARRTGRGTRSGSTTGRWPRSPRRRVQVRRPHPDGVRAAPPALPRRAEAELTHGQGERPGAHRQGSRLQRLVRHRAARRGG